MQVSPTYRPSRTDGILASFPWESQDSGLCECGGRSVLIAITEAALASIRSSRAPEDEPDVDRDIRILGRRDDITGLRRVPLEVVVAAGIPKHVDDIIL